MKLDRNFPSVVKYMGSKTEVLGLIENGIDYLDKDYDWICDLFAGSATLSGALRNKANVISNDVQKYSSVFAKTYLNNYDWGSYPNINIIINAVEERVKKFNDFFPMYKGKFKYYDEMTLEEFNLIEEEQRLFINKNEWEEFPDHYYLFVKYYSGTYWNYDQCIWIDSYKAVIDTYKENEELYNLLLSCLIFAMAYNSQSTGHYAQYRIPETESSQKDILIYRKKNITEFFIRKYDELKQALNKKNKFKFMTMSLTDEKCLDELPKNTLVYADPPYCFVHYSRFYHILETLVNYDYPKIEFKGRYRNDRYQSEYCIKTEVKDAFVRMFKKIEEKKADVILSYSNSSTNTIAFGELVELCYHSLNKGKESLNEINFEKECNDFFKSKRSMKTFLEKKEINYEISIMKMPYNHSRMGRKNTKTIDVTELIIIGKYVSKKR